MDRVFTLAEANQLIPRLEECLTAVRRGKAVLGRTKDEIRKASGKAALGGGSLAGAQYVSTLEQISRALHDIREIGVHLKDLDQGLCDFPYEREGRIVYLCWRAGETEIKWWHEMSSGYKERQPLEGAGL